MYYVHIEIYYLINSNENLIPLSNPCEVVYRKEFYKILTNIPILRYLMSS